jgi:hypothetical protein
LSQALSRAGALIRLSLQQAARRSQAPITLVEISSFADISSNLAGVIGDSSGLLCRACG